MPTAPAAEVCDDVDNDCDRLADEELSCPEPKPRPTVLILAGQSNIVELGVNAELSPQARRAEMACRGRSVPTSSPTTSSLKLPRRRRQTSPSVSKRAVAPPADPRALTRLKERAGA